MVKGSAGQVLERRRKGGTIFALRFRAYGERHYLTLGGEAEGWTRGRAEDELRRILADAELGLWVSPLRRSRPGRAPGPQSAVPDFGPFATALISSREGQVAAGTFEYLRWGLAHLMPSFASWNLREIDIEAVDLYREHKVRESDTRRCAIERGRPRRRLREPPRRQIYLDAAEQIEALLEAAAQLDCDPLFRCSDRRAIIATLVLAGDPPRS